MLVRLIFLCFLWHTTRGLELTPENLSSHYKEIFPRTHNRNAASHLWTTYILKNAEIANGKATADEIYGLFSAFCPVSGSPISPARARSSRWFNLKIKKATDTSKIEIGRANFCCSPCPCDLEEFVRYDTKQIKTKNGMMSFPVLVIGDPCKFPDKKIPRDASELYCESGKLHGITLSDKGHVIIGMLQPSNKPAANDASTKGPVNKHGRWIKGHQDYCQWRRTVGKYAGGMGAIFANLSKINPIN